MGFIHPVDITSEKEMKKTTRTVKTFEIYCQILIHNRIAASIV